ncbi:MAG: methionine--tRNA ligase [Candidatus Zambryskibacteria bacterium CG10_big_fil_rev_8_21_14_0_10_34_34]|uniref:Methionine--tRNA ligase n=1 Tax=Candidatus Zambryskibacteria bacterium CG10_big_fil_rev_8_21_14_0_10_34_34 TaxID=1975114 RepID=A0A2H0R0D9_9BACT|nr:MAG: methionine--tRNA ligase [Candidatus Zambryskibacteria bacterium CG10_big_fil_rev_8_21_14_0_10_34_34]
MSKTFYITTTLPYVNADLHMGHALEFVRADSIARYKKLAGFDVFFNTGTDEHGMKIFETAKEAGISPKEFVDDAFKRFKEQVQSFGISDDVHYVRTTDERHEKSAQKFWQKVLDNGFIYKKNYKRKYCVGCEEEKTESELVNGRCTIHTNREIEIIDEENYFFAFSKFQEKLLKFYEKNHEFVIPKFRYNEVISFVKNGLEDFSISRLKSKMPWGIPVPNDDEHIMYVWFDALTNYISTLGWGTENEKYFDKYWKEGTPTQYCGKDNTRFQAIMWQAMLMAADVSDTYQIVVNGHITGEGGVKMSKSLGNIVDPKKVSAEYGTDALRYFLLREVSSFEDSPFSEERFKETYNANLANGLGNLVSRVMKMAEDNLDKPVEISEREDMQEFFDYLNKFEINKSCDFIWSKIGEMDKFIQEMEPFKIVKTDKEKGQKIISDLVIKLYYVARMLNPILPETSEKIKELIKQNKSPDKPLFIRK